MEEKENKELNEEVKKEEEQEEKKPRLDIKHMSEHEAKKLLRATLDENERLVKELEETKKQAAVNKDSWYRVAADFDNFRKKNSNTYSTAYNEGKADAIIKILVVGDSLDRALKLNLDDSVREGIELVAKQFKETLESMNVREINPEGEAFDPNTQEAILTMPAEEGEEAGKVKQVIKKGYKLGDKVIRYAQVVIIG